MACHECSNYPSHATAPNNQNYHPAYATIMPARNEKFLVPSIAINLFSLVLPNGHNSEEAILLKKILLSHIKKKNPQ